MKLCRKCNITKSLDSFGKDTKRKGGITSACKECRNKNSYAWNKANPEKVKEANSLNRINRKEYYSDPVRKMKYRNLDLQKRFGISQLEYEQMFEAQDGVCAICKKFRLNKGKKYMAVDHCHKTGKVRGILCHFCNRAIGLFDDDQKLLTQAIEYLAKE